MQEHHRAGEDNRSYSDTMNISALGRHSDGVVVYIQTRDRSWLSNSATSSSRESRRKLYPRIADSNRALIAFADRHLIVLQTDRSVSDSKRSSLLYKPGSKLVNGGLMLHAFQY